MGDAGHNRFRDPGCDFCQRTETQLGKQLKFLISADAPDHLFLKVVDAQLALGRDGSGKITQITLHQAAM